MSESFSMDSQDDILTTVEITHFWDYLHARTKEQLKEVSDLLYGTIVPTLANNRVISHELTFVCALFLFMDMWVRDPSTFPNPAAIRFDDQSVFNNISYHYCDKSRQKYIDSVLARMFNLFLRNSKEIYARP
jgi:hypothetical protein